MSAITVRQHFTDAKNQIYSCAASNNKKKKRNIATKGRMEYLLSTSSSFADFEGNEISWRF
jgi:hypothetical protein